jgi:predicted membrane metal-binding protein
MRGIVFGDSSRLPEDAEEAFRRSGLTHLMSLKLMESLPAD